jgi:formate dehydrogenase major subunit
MSKVTITIDGMQIAAEEGMTVLQAAQANGLYIPNLCNHPDLKPAGLCRVCVVKMDDWKIVISCKQQVKDGMVISTEDPQVQQIRKNTVELLVANHPLTCLTCEADGNCELQRVAHYAGVTQESLNRYRRSVRSEPMDRSNPFFDIDHNKCILCGICVRTCDELQNINAIDYAKRGVASLISTLGNKPIAESRCESCGECVVRCPVAALAPKDRQEPMWEVKSICSYCGVGCGVMLGVRGQKVVSVRGD